MKKYIITIAAALSASIALNAQLISQGFEAITLDSGNVINGQNGEKLFEITGSVPNYSLKLPIQYDTSWGGYWSGGWAISKQIDGSNGPSDFSKHLYCAKPGFGAERNAQNKFIGKTFAVGMNGSYWLQKSVSNEGVLSFYVTNSTYAYNSMKNGDNFAKKFGGASGNDADSFVLNIKFFIDTLWVASKKVVLADYRFANNAKDFLLDTWQAVNLPTYFPGGFVDSITFELESSDNGQFGMNTPGFFCVDMIECGRWLSTQKVVVSPLSVYPNPTKDILRLNCASQIRKVEVFNAVGQLVKFQAMHSMGENALSLNVANLDPGNYSVIAYTQQGTLASSFVKH